MSKHKKFKVDKAKAAERVREIWPVLKKAYPEAKVALRFNDPLELLIATILSAQCTDVRVNIVTKDLFKKYKSAKSWAGADIGQLESEVRSTAPPIPAPRMLPRLLLAVLRAIMEPL